MKMRSKPIVIFAGSYTPNWDKKVCDSKPKKPERTEEEKKLLEIYDNGKNVRKLAETPNPISTTNIRPRAICF